MVLLVEVPPRASACALLASSDYGVRIATVGHPENRPNHLPCCLSVFWQKLQRWWPTSARRTRHLMHQDWIRVGLVRNSGIDLRGTTGRVFFTCHLFDGA
jgi:hypothetical protein